MGRADNCRKVLLSGHYLNINPANTRWAGPRTVRAVRTPARLDVLYGAACTTVATDLADGRKFRRFGNSIGKHPAIMKSGDVIGRRR